MKKQNEVHTLLPYINKDSKILVLGSFPSVKSREENFYYAHKQNRFWKVLELVFCDEEIDENNIDNFKFSLNTVEDKKDFLNKNKIALFDVIYECEIKGSSDSSIDKVVPSNISKLIQNTNIQLIVVNGNAAKDLFNKYNKELIGKINILYMPSTSSANARMRLSNLYNIWSKILN